MMASWPGLMCGEWKADDLIVLFHAGWRSLRKDVLECVMRDKCDLVVSVRDAECDDSKV